jgi:hypothetical protein
MKLTHEKETHSSKCFESFLQGFKVFSNNTKKNKAKDIRIKHLVVSCCIFVCFMAMAQKRIYNTIKMWNNLQNLRNNSLDICGHVLPSILNSDKQLT